MRVMKWLDLSCKRIEKAKGVEVSLSMVVLLLDVQVCIIVTRSL